MFRFLSLSVIVTFLISCSNNESKSRKRYKEFWVESNFEGDTIFNGLTKFYDSQNKLQAAEYYSQGIKDGPSLSYHSNGQVYDSVFYQNGLKNGYRFVYDSAGHLGLQEYNFMGRQFGPQVFFSNGMVTDYNFLSFEKRNLYSYSSSSSGDTIRRKGELMTLIPYQTYSNGELQNWVFAYLVHPPKLSVSYELVTRDPSTQKESIVANFQDKVFLDTLVSCGQMKATYFIKANVYDSLDGNQRIHYGELVYSD